jgi:hypothetical protein
MVWDAQKGGNRKRKDCEVNNNNILVSGRIDKFCLLDDKDVDTSGIIHMSASKRSSGQLHDQESHECSDDALKNAEIMNAEDIVNNGITASKYDSGNNYQASKINCRPFIKRDAKNHACDDGDYVTHLNLSPVHIKNYSSSHSITKHSLLHYSPSVVNESLGKISKNVDSQHNTSRNVESNATKPSHVRKSFFPKQKGTRKSHEFRRLNGSCQNLENDLACSNGDVASESGNQCHPLLLGYPQSQTKKYHVKVETDSIPLLSEMQHMKTNFYHVDNDQSKSSIFHAYNDGCELISAKPSEVFLTEAFKAGWELTMQMPVEGIEEVGYFLESMKWRNDMNVLMALQYEILL